MSEWKKGMSKYLHSKYLNRDLKLCACPRHEEPCLEAIFVAFSSCFTAYPLDETALGDSVNADRVDPGGLPSGKRSFLGHVHMYRSAALKQNMDLAY